MHVRVLFECLRAADLKLTKCKRSFLKAHVQYLGHYISGQWLEPVPEKLEALVKMPSPEDVTAVRKFLGFVGYYRKFIPRYLDVARPLTNLTRKDTLFQWNHFVPGGIRDAEGFLAWRSLCSSTQTRIDHTCYILMPVNTPGQGS